jgi:hypothetical protein
MEESEGLKREIKDTFAFKSNDEYEYINGTTWAIGSNEMFELLNRQFEFLERIKIKSIIYVWRISRENELGKKLTQYVYCKDYQLDSGIIISPHIFNKLDFDYIDNNIVNDDFVMLSDCEITLRGLNKVKSITIDYDNNDIFKVPDLEEKLTEIVRNNFPVINKKENLVLKSDNTSYKLIISKIFDERDKEQNEGFTIDTEIAILFNFIGKVEPISTFLGNQRKSDKNENTDWYYNKKKDEEDEEDKGHKLGGTSEKLTQEQIRELRLKNIMNQALKQNDNDYIVDKNDNDNDYHVNNNNNDKDKKCDKEENKNDKDDYNDNEEKPLTQEELRKARLKYFENLYKK